MKREDVRRNFEIVVAVLFGESQRSVERRLGVDQAEVRKIVARYCRRANPEVYFGLLDEGKGVRVNLPSSALLISHREAFLPHSVLENGSQLGGAGKVTKHVTRHLFLTSENFWPETGDLLP
jgi:hypothetical protein